jgi:LuxR family maltose regulon positive regulatory protein
MPRKTRPRQLLLQSKLQPPLSGRFVVPRTRLLDRVSSARHARLVVVRAPAGFGKTTLMAECMADLRKRGTPAAWLTLDVADNDPVRFLTYLIAAIQKSIPEFEPGAEEPDLLFAGHAPTGVFLYVLDRLSQLGGPLCLFLDDFAVIRSQEVLEIVRQLIHHLPPDMRVFVALRQAPELGLGRLRAQGDVLEIELSDLLFTRDEAEQFVRITQGLHLDEQAMDGLYGFTEGWPAGLQLSTLSRGFRESRGSQGRGQAGVARNIADYLVDEVLRSQPEDVQSFVTQTSILDTLTGPVCDALTGRTDSVEMLKLLEEQNLFLIPLDEERRCYRYHSIFATFLRSRLEQRDPKRFLELHRAACEWYSAGDDLHRAAEHALAVGDVEFAAKYMERSAFDLVRTGQAATVAVWGDRLPARVLDGYPELRLAYAYALTVRYRYQQALEVLDPLSRHVDASSARRHFFRDVLCVRALSLFVQDRIPECEKITLQVLAEPDLEEDRETRFLPTIFTLAAYLSMTAGRGEEAVRHLWKTTQRVGEAAGVMKLYGRFTAGCLSLTQGRLREALALATSTLSEIEASPARYSGGGTAVAVLKAELLYEQGELDGAEKLLTAHRAMLPTLIPDVMIVGFRTLARLRLAAGDLSDATRHLMHLERLGAERSAPRISATARQERVRIALQRGELERALEIHREHDDRAAWAPFEGRCMKGSDPETPAVARVRLLSAQGQARKALEVAKEALGHAEASGFFRQALLLRILAAKAHEACAEKRQALRVLREALVSAQGEGFVRAFVDEGVSRMIQEIRKVAAAASMRGDEVLSVAFLDRVLGGTGAASPAPGEGEAASAAAPEEPLTDRELDILRKVAMGLSNEDLAEQLYLSVHTVRFHLRNIFLKLGAHNRTQAVALGRQLGLVR